jgi:hypothetical protein
MLASFRSRTGPKSVGNLSAVKVCFVCRCPATVAGELAQISVGGVILWLIFRHQSTQLSWILNRL